MTHHCRAYEYFLALNAGDQGGGPAEINIRAWEILGSSLRTSILVSLLTLLSLSGHASDAPKPVFVKATCLNKISAAVFSSFKEQIRDSQKYQLVPDLSDNGRMDLVLTVNMSCAERSDIAAVASAYGHAKCFGAKNCHHAIDGYSIRSDLCESNAAAECGRSLFKAFDSYVSNPIKPSLRLN